MKGKKIEKVISFFLVLVIILTTMSSSVYAIADEVNDTKNSNKESTTIKENQTEIKDEQLGEKDIALDENTNIKEEKQEVVEDDKIDKVIDNEKETLLNEDNIQYDDVNLEEKKQEVIQDKLNMLNQNNVTLKANNQIISDGTYKVQSALDVNKVLDIAGGSYALGANLQIWEWANVKQQQYKFTYTDDGYYIITCLNSNKVLDVQNANYNSGANVWQYDLNYSDAQKWELRDAGNGYFVIVSKLSGKFLDISGAKSYNGTNVQVFDGNYTNAQKFRLVEMKEIKGEQTIKNGRYKISSCLNTNKVLDIAGGSKLATANLQIWDWSNVKQQQFDVTYLNNGCYSIKGVRSKKVFDVQEGSLRSGANIWQYDANYSPAQEWIIKDAGDGYFYIISNLSKMYLDISGASTVNGTNVQVYEGNFSNAQKFKFDEIQRMQGEQTLEDGIYKISSCLDTSKVLDIAGGSMNSGANLQLWSWGNADQQKYKVAYQGNGVYTITSFKSDKVLDVEDGNMDSGANVWQCTPNYSEAQQWIIKDAGNGYYYIISNLNELYLDVYGGFTANGTNIQVYEGNFSNAQKFQFKEANKLIGEKTIEDGTYKIATALNENRVLDIAGGSLDSKANTQIWDWGCVKQQKFNVKYQGDGYYLLTVAASNKVLEVANNNMGNAANVWQNDLNYTEPQKWIIMKDNENDGYYYIVSKYSEKYLDICNGSSNNGTNVQVFAGNGSKAQKFKFVYAEKNGIDVSGWNGNINWEQVKPYIDFAILRIGFRGYGEAGNFAEDVQFKTNIRGVMENNIPVGIYFFSQATTRNEGVAEANEALRILKNYPIQYPIVIDTENSSDYPNGRADNITNQERTWAIQGFCDRIKEAGYTPMIYASRDWFKDKLYMDQLQGIDIWVAHYLNGAPNVKTDYKGSYQMWQYASDGSLPGISGRVDMNILYKDYFTE